MNLELFDNDSVSQISEFVENKSSLLNEVKQFKEKDKLLYLNIEEYRKNLSDDEKNKFDQIVKLMYQIEEYYITLAYMLGSKYGTDVEKI